MKDILKLCYWRLALPNSVTLLPPSVRVASGPFAGMRYIMRAHGSGLGAKIAGTYEKELHSILSASLRGAFSHVIDIGAAEGYYAVGFARAGFAVTAFESTLDARILLTELAARNNVHVDVRGICDVDQLRNAISPSENTLVICDIEGAELDVLKPDLVPALANAWLLVEAHDILQDGITEALRDRFEPSHSVSVIDTTPRQISDFPRQHHSLFKLLPEVLAIRSMAESRPGPMSWLWLEPKSGAGVRV